MNESYSLPYEPTLVEYLFACKICGKLLRELYDGVDMSKGLRDGTDFENKGVINRLWLTACGHPICTDCIPGGGQRVPAFFPKVSANAVVSQALNSIHSVSVRNLIVLIALLRRVIRAIEPISISAASKMDSSMRHFPYRSDWHKWRNLAIRHWFV